MSEQSEPVVEAPTRSRGVLAPVAAAVAVVVVAGGGFAAWRFLADPGTQPAEVMPADTFALATVDLDPSGGQKIEAFKALRKFPALRAKVKAGSGEDLVENLVTDALQDSSCKALSWAEDFEPWIGQTFAVGGVALGDGKPAWVAAIETKDAGEASSSLSRIASCAGEDGGFGWTVTGDYVIASDTTGHAKAIAASGATSSLASSASYQKWMGEAGDDRGFASFYLGKKAPEAIADAMDARAADTSDSDATNAADRRRYEEALKDLPPAQREKLLQQFDDEVAAMDDVPPPKPGTELREQLGDFTGMAGVLRFADDGFELSVAAGGVQQTGTAKVGDLVGAMDRDTAAVVALAPPKDLARNLTGSDGTPGLLDLLVPSELLRQAGLELPGDLETLLGSRLSVSLGGDAPADLDAAQEPADVPLGLLVDTDPDEFQTVLGKVEKATGMTLADVPASLSASDDRVAVASNKSYADALLEKGDLGSTKVFRDVVPDADKASFIAFAQLDGSWRTALDKAAAQDASAREMVANLAVVRALGVSGWADGTTTHGLVRLSLR